MSRYASPALDLHFHFFSSTRKTLRDQSYEDLLHVYYGGLSDIVRDLGSDPEKLFRFSDLMDELKAFGKYAMIIGVSMIPFVLSEQDEIADMELYSERFAIGEKVSLFASDINPDSVYSQAVNEVVGDIIHYGFDHWFYFEIRKKYSLFNITVGQMPSLRPDGKFHNDMMV